jgi:chaperone modulatory protein CbpM
MSALDPIAREFGLAVEELSLWVERRWVLPGRDGADIVFTQADRARVRMIVEFRRDLALDDEAIPVVLDLIDRLHAARTELRSVLDAIAELPVEEQRRVFRRIRNDGNR